MPLVTEGYERDDVHFAAASPLAVTGGQILVLKSTAAQIDERWQALRFVYRLEDR